jgi:glycosyltransferase involved in cell wall biosynthesis/O-antigen/teichoic acid export membrane protein
MLTRSISPDSSREGGSADFLHLIPRLWQPYLKVSPKLMANGAVALRSITGARFWSGWVSVAVSLVAVSVFFGTLAETTTNAESVALRHRVHITLLTHQRVSVADRSSLRRLDRCDMAETEPCRLRPPGRPVRPEREPVHYARALRGRIPRHRAGRRNNVVQQRHIRQPEVHIPAARNATTTQVARSGLFLSVSAGLVGVVSYACTLLMAHLLPSSEFTEYAAAQMIVGIVGIVAHALVPLPLADIVRRHGRGSPDRRDGMAFALLMSIAAGAVAAAATWALLATFAQPEVAVAAGVASFVLFAVAPAQGWLQGELRFTRYAVVSVLEVTARVVFSLIAVAAGAGPAGALIGFAVGGLVLVCGPAAMLGDAAWRPSVLGHKARWAETGDVAAVQFVVSALVGADVVLVAVLGNGTTADAGFQALAALAKGPVYVAAGTVLVVFPVLRGCGAAAATVLRSSLGSFRMLALIAAVLLATVPAPLVMLVLPVEYASSLSLAPWLAAAGLGYGAITVLATVLLAVRRYRRTRAALIVAAATVSAGLLIGWYAASVTGLAIGAAIGALIATVGMAVIAAPVLPPGTGAASTRDLALAAALLLVAWLARPQPLAWIIVAAVYGLGLLRAGRSNKPEESIHDNLHGSRRMRILHLGFEDPAMPGAGGGSRRTHEINRRLAARGHEVTVLTTRFPGNRDRVQDGVSYVHIGIGAGRNRLSRTVGYAIVAVRACRSRAADLVVEDFFAPVSTAAAPLWSGRPTVGVVQWLNAREKATQYRLPFHLIERFGVRQHRQMIAVSEHVGETLRALNPAASVDVIGNGLSPDAVLTQGDLGRDVLFVGRLEIAQKGLDLLILAWAAASQRIAGDLVLAGDGPDEARLRSLIEQAGVVDRVRFVGRVDGREALALMGRARLVAMPSRFETFGMVAIEAMATGTPVVAFDIDALREVLPPGCTRRVHAFDVDEYADTLVATYNDTVWIEAAVPLARRFAGGFDWDVLAVRQEAVYASVARIGAPA